jgi:tripartite-type tricarboxylate transporter receptor subunit TctC
VGRGRTTAQRTRAQVQGGSGVNTAIIRAAAAAFVSLLAGLSANAQSDAQWPTKSVRIIVPTAAGGPTDYTSRILADELTARLGHAFVIENRPGAGHQIGMTAVANAEPDGYTFGAVSTPYVINPAIYQKLPYDHKALKPLFLLTTSPLLLGVPSSLSVNSVKELVALAKTKPGELNMASPGNTTGPHLAGELFQSVSRVKLQHVPYRGGPQSTTALIRGEAQVYFDTPTGILPHVESSQVRVLAQTSTTRVAQLGNIPTMAEAGFPGCEFDVYNGFVVPAGVPAPIVARIEAAIKAVASDPKVRDRLVAAGFAVVALPGAEFAGLLSKELSKWQKVVVDRGISPP